MRATWTLVTCLSLLTLAPRGGAAQPPPEPTAPALAVTPRKVAAGKVVLPLTGLAIELPRDKRKGATWSLTGSWSLTGGGASFDSRDVVDLEVDGTLVAGNWIHVGYFDAGACAKVVEELAVPDRWTATKTLWGASFAIAGGTYDLGGALGKVPAVAMCAGPADGARLLVYHFFLERKPPKPGAPSVAALGKDKLLEQVVKAWRASRSGVVQPTRAPEIRRRGEQAAARTVTLARSKLEVALPDDGFVWLARSDDDADFLDRMAPSLPDLTIELVRIPDTTCAAVAAMIETATEAEPPPAGVPYGWTAFPTLRLDARLERLICRDLGGAALMVGLMGIPTGDPQARDFGPLTPVLDALAAAAAR